MIANLVKDYTQLIKERLAPDCREVGEPAASDWQPPPAADAGRQRSILQRPAPPDAALR